MTLEHCAEPRPRIYLAGPDVFLPDADAVGRRLRDVCAEFGLEGVFPLDAEIDLRGLKPTDQGLRISAANEELIRSCRGAIANITPFRGPSADPGTVYEIGFARALGLVVTAYTTDPRPFAERTREWVGTRGAAPDRDAEGMLLEDFGLTDNLMIDGGIRGSGGAVGESFRWCVEWMADHLGARP